MSTKPIYESVSIMAVLIPIILYMDYNKGDAAETLN